MQCSTVVAASGKEEVDGLLFAVRSLWQRLSALSDRRGRRGRRYGLPLLLLLMVLAKLSGEDRPSGIADWVRHRWQSLASALCLKLPRAPHHNTFRRVLATALIPEELDRVVGDLLTELRQSGRSVLICMDGKTIKGTMTAEVPEGLQLLVAYMPEEGVVLLQVPVEDKSNEIKAAPSLLAGLDLRGKIVAADALHTQRALSAQIIAARGEYVCLAKDNQPALRTDIEELFSRDDRTVEGGRLSHDFQSAVEVNKGHGRRETRRITVSSELKGYLDWPGAEQVFCLERERIKTKSGKHERKVIYGLTSLNSDEASPARLLELTRSYWGVESGLHYRRDVTFHEDATRLTKNHAGHAMASLNNLVIGLLRLAGFTNLAAARRYCNASLTNAITLRLSAYRT